MPSKRTKPTWQQNQPAFLLTSRPGEDDDQNGIVSEHTASKFSISVILAGSSAAFLLEDIGAIDFLKS
jgi:hypothetical protein